MEYDHGDSFAFDFEPNEFSSGLESKRKPSPRSYVFCIYSIIFERKWKSVYVSVNWKGRTIHFIVPVSIRDWNKKKTFSYSIQTYFVNYLRRVIPSYDRNCMCFIVCVL